MPTRSISTLSILLILVSLLAVGAAIWIFYTAPSVVTATSILGAVSVSLGNLKQFLERRRDAEPDRRNHQIGFTPRVATKPVRVAPSFKSGLYGGLIGGGLSGLIIGIAYYFQYADPLGPIIILIVFIYASIVGAIIGASSQFVIIRFRYQAVEKNRAGFFFNEVWGGIVGGALSGGLAGLLGMVLFGSRDAERVDKYVLLLGSIVGSIPVVVSVVFYEYQGRWRNVMRTLVSSLVIAPFAVGLASIAIWALGIDLGSPGWQGAIRQGLPLGAIVGLMLGLQIGLVLRVDRLWKVASE